MRTYAFQGLVLWIIGGTILVYTLTSNLENNGGLTAGHEELLLKDGDFELKVSKPISYAPDQSQVTLTKELNTALGKIADHLIEDPEKRLLITGLYTLKEANESVNNSVGSERSENLKRHLISLGADPSGIYTSSKLINQQISGPTFKGVELSIIDKNKKVNTNPLINPDDNKMVSQTGFKLPYYTRDFGKLTPLVEEINNYIERVMESPDMALVLSINSKDSQSKNLLNALNAYIKELTYGIDIQVIMDFIEDETVNNKDKQIYRIDIGIKRFQNNLEFLGS